jgi:hypothetical protein
MNNTGRKVVKGSKTSAPMVMTATSAMKGSAKSVATAKAPSATVAPAIAVKATAATTTAKAGPTREEIARRSYEIFLARGGTDGHDLEDWVKAEHDLGA